MSAGAFIRARYESNGGDIHPIRIQPETLALTLGGTANAAPAGAVDSSISARVSQGNRALGLKPRSVTIAWTGTPPAGYAAGRVIKLPILTEALYDSVNRGTTGTYLSTAVEVVSKSPERIG